jgi:hypothetical protein
MTIENLGRMLARKVGEDPALITGAASQIGIEIAPVLDDPRALLDLNVIGLVSLADFLGLDWRPLAENILK